MQDSISIKIDFLYISNEQLENWHLKNTIIYSSSKKHEIDINKVIIKFLWKGKRIRIAKLLLLFFEIDNIGQSRLPNFKSYYNVTVNTTVWYWQWDRHTDQWKRIESKRYTHINKWPQKDSIKELFGGDRTFLFLNCGGICIILCIYHKYK